MQTQNTTKWRYSYASKGKIYTPTGFIEAGYSMIESGRYIVWYYT